jgi:hypothetical protein
MRPIAKYSLWAVALAGFGVTAFATMRMADDLIGYASPFTPGIISATFMAAWICLVRRYGPRGPVDLRRQRIWFMASLAAAVGIIPAVGLIAGWMLSTYPKPECSAPLSTRLVSLDRGATRSIAVSLANEEKIAHRDTAPQCHPLIDGG